MGVLLAFSNLAGYSDLQSLQVSDFIDEKVIKNKSLIMAHDQALMHFFTLLADVLRYIVYLQLYTRLQEVDTSSNMAPELDFWVFFTMIDVAFPLASNL